MKNEKIYELNLAVLRSINPLLVRKIENCNTNRYAIEITGEKRIINLRDTKKNILYYDCEDPKRVIREDLDLLKIKNARIAFFLGFGLGYELQVYADEYAHKSKTNEIFVVEKEIEIFKLALTYHDYRPMFKEHKIHFFIGDDEEEFFVFFQKYIQDKGRIMLSKAIKPVYIYSALAFNKDFYITVLKKMKEAIIYTTKFFGNSPDDSLIGIENMLANVDEIIANPGIKMLYNKFKGKPAVIVSTGPSLDKNKHLLKGLEDKALIISVDASLRILMNMGVKPHLVTSLERFPMIAKLMSGYDKEEVSDVYYAACPLIHKSCYEAYPGPRINVYRSLAQFSWIEVEKGVLEIKHSSGNMAFKVADALGCSPIILIGQDLSYGKDPRITHAEGNDYGEAQEDYLNEDYFSKAFEVLGNDGEMVLTSHDWNDFRKAYEIDISLSNALCINSTEGGAFINGTSVMPFEDAIKKYIHEPFHPLNTIKESLAEFNDGDRHRDFAIVKNKLLATIDDLKFIREKCYEGHQLVEANLSKIDEWLNGNAYTNDELLLRRKLILEIFALRDQVVRKEPTFSGFLLHVIQSFYIKIESDFMEMPDKYDDPNMSDLSIAAGHYKWFTYIHDTVNIVLESMELALSNLLKLEETL